MCGFAGFFGKGDIDDLFAMNAAILHRGPDRSGYWVHPKAPLFIGHQRLIIVDAAGGSQPMWSDNREVGVIYNGEIYNNLQLRSVLEAKGHRFSSRNSDTETLLRAYLEWGELVPEKLNGMFAFCIVDLRKSRMLLARDRHGEKPLYWAQQAGLFAFGSELSAIMSHSRFSKRPNQKSLQKLLVHSFLPSPNTLVEDCWKLEPGSLLTFDWRTRTVATRTYWKFRIQPDPNFARRKIDDIADEFRSVFKSSVHRRLAADVPLGFLLSGGLDSTALISSAAEILPRQHISAFTLGFEQPSFDETEPASKVASHFNIDHHVQTMTKGEFQQKSRLSLSRIDEPLFDPSIVPTTMVFEMASKHVTVVLTGDGGDELFCGYDPFLAIGPATLYQKFVPRNAHRLVEYAAAIIPKSHANMNLHFKVKKALSAMPYDARYWNPTWLGTTPANYLPELIEQVYPVEELFEEVSASWDDSDATSMTDKSLEFYTRFYLPDNILTKVDRASMMFSTEARSIFLDNEIVDFCARLPRKYKIRHGNRKYLLKHAFKKEIPAFVSKRKKKGFGIPVTEWISYKIIEQPKTGIAQLKTDLIQDLWERQISGDIDERQLLWGVHCLTLNETFRELMQ